MNGDAVLEFSLLKKVIQAEAQSNFHYLLVLRMMLEIILNQNRLHFILIQILQIMLNIQ